MTTPAPPITTRRALDVLFDECNTAGLWGLTDQLGAANYLDPGITAAACRLVKSGIAVSCAWDLDTVRGPDNPNPARQELDMSLDDAVYGESGDLRIAGETLSVAVHGDAHSHIDALCHVAFAGYAYNHTSANGLFVDGKATRLGMEVLANGIATRGVLLDLPLARGVEWLEPGDTASVDDILESERLAGVQIQRGDFVLIRTGHSKRRTQLGPWNAAELKAGIHPDVLPLLAKREIVGVGYDGDGETVPNRSEGVDYPIHAIAIPALGWWTMDSLNLDAVSDQCRISQRWSFFLVVAPLRLVGGTGSPVNPLAIF